MGEQCNEILYLTFRAPCYYYVINIDKKVYAKTNTKLNEEGTIGLGVLKPLMNEERSMLVVLGSWCLTKAINGFSKFAHMMWKLRVNKTRWLLHVDILGESTL